jgi:hypothetical protein
VTVNEHVVAALNAAADRAGQPREVALRLITWLDALARGNLTVGDSAEEVKRIASLLDQVQLSASDAELDLNNLLDEL